MPEGVSRRAEYTTLGTALAGPCEGSYAQALPGHAGPSGEIAEALDRALDALISQLESSSRSSPAAEMASMTAGVCARRGMRSTGRRAVGVGGVRPGRRAVSMPPLAP